MGAGFHGGFGGTHGNKEKHKDYIENTLPKSSPIKIPSSAIIIEEQKNGYEQVKYTWKKDDYSYTSRWHTRTPNAPKEQGDSWVVQRDTCWKKQMGVKERMAGSYTSKKKWHCNKRAKGDVR